MKEITISSVRLELIARKLHNFTPANSRSSTTFPETINRHMLEVKTQDLPSSHCLGISTKTYSQQGGSSYKRSLGIYTSNHEVNSIQNEKE